jgi:excisionase family DNA binding protein
VKLPLTVAEAAASLGITVSGVTMAIQRGRLKAEKRAGAWWVDPREVERYRAKYSRPRKVDK